MKDMKPIFKKELDRIFKDAKMIFSVFILPIASIIIILTLVSTFARTAFDRVDYHESIIVTVNEPSDFEDFMLSLNPNIRINPVKETMIDHIKDGIRDGTTDLLIVFPLSFMYEIQNYEPGAMIPQVKIFHNPSESFSGAARFFSVEALEVYRQNLLSKRVADMDELTVFTVNADDPEMIVMDEARAGGQILGNLLPYFVIILLFGNAMGLGTDMVAGEKERGTLASLLVSPIRRSSIILGKVFSLMVIAGLSSIISVISMIIFMPQILGGDMEAAGVSVNMSLEQMLMLATLLILIAFMYATIIVLISVFAKSVREANTYIYPVYMLLMVIGFSTMFDIGTPGDFVYFIPLYNSILALQGILTQGIVMWQYVVTIITTIITSALLIFALTKVFESEKIMGK